MSLDPRDVVCARVSVFRQVDKAQIEDARLRDIALLFRRHSPVVEGGSEFRIHLEGCFELGDRRVPVSVTCGENAAVIVIAGVLGHFELQLRATAQPLLFRQAVEQSPAKAPIRLLGCFGQRGPVTVHRFSEKVLATTGVDGTCFLAVKKIHRYVILPLCLMSFARTRYSSKVRATSPCRSLRRAQTPKYWS